MIKKAIVKIRDCDILFTAEKKELLNNQDQPETHPTRSKKI
jgi:hypothetical protein